MKAIYKYQLFIEEQTQIKMPEGAEIIRVAGLDGALWVWAIVETEKPLITQRFRLFKTGGEIPSDLGLTFVGCGAVFIQQELMLYVFKED